MHRKKRVICAVLCGVLLCVGGLAVWQRDNIGAALSALRFSQEELEEKLEQNDQTIKDAMENIPNVSIRDVTQEEKDALKEGTLTQEELIQNLIGNEPKPEQKPEDKPQKTEDEPQKPEDTQTSQPEQKEEPAQQSEYEKKLNELIAEVYVLREEFLIKLDETQAAAIADYKAIPADQRTTKKIASLVSGYMAKGLDMEKECDAKIKQIALDMEELLKENGGDLSLAQTVFDTYVEEKSLKKAWYMAELKKRGMI